MTTPTKTTDAPTEPTEKLPHPARDEIELSEVLHALSDPVRLKMVAYLAGSDRERTCGSFDVPVTKSTCTHHFKVLREAGIIRQRQQGTARLNTLRRDDLEARFPGLLATILVNARVFDGVEEYLAAQPTPAEVEA
jgi:DNA-binding transcriptional ArsR family regulator